MLIITYKALHNLDPGYMKDCFPLQISAQTLLSSQLHSLKFVIFSKAFKNETFKAGFPPFLLDFLNYLYDAFSILKVSLLYVLLCEVRCLRLGFLSWKSELEI